MTTGFYSYNSSPFLSLIYLFKLYVVILGLVFMYFLPIFFTSVLYLLHSNEWLLNRKALHVIKYLISASIFWAQWYRN